MIRVFKLACGWTMVLLSLVLYGCAVSSSSRSHGALSPVPGESASSRAFSTYSTNPAVIALLERAEEWEQAGFYEQAAAALERALRLEPRNAMLWNRLAGERLNQGQWQDAVELAAKSNTLATQDGDLRGRNWALIAEAKERLGDRQGAEEARSRMVSDGTVH